MSSEVIDAHAFQEQAWRLGLERRAPRRDRSRWVAALTPAPPGIVATVVAVLAMLPGLGLLAAMLKFGEGGPAAQVDEALFFFGPFCVAPAALILSVAAALAGRPGARALLLGGAALLTALAGATFLVGTLMGEEPVYDSFGIALAAALLFFGPFAFALSLPAAFFAIRTPGHVRRELVEAQERRLLDVMLQRGAADLADLARAAGADLDETRELLAGLARQNRLAARVDSASGRVHTARRLAALHALLVELVEKQGEISVEELSAELGEPAPTVDGWIAELLAAGHLSARVDGNRISFDPTGRGDARVRSCVDCGGPMKAVGRGVYYCAYCGAESVL